MRQHSILKNPILALALPAVVSNITVPLLGLVDTAIVGHLGSADRMAAIAVCTTIFNMIYWLFGFLRMATTGLTAQAYGKADGTVEACLLSALRLALLFALGLVVLQIPLLRVSLWMMSPGSDVALWASRYYYICIWGAPAMLSIYSLSGWFIGRQNTRVPMQMAILQNVVNILFSLFFVFALGMDVRGVALGTVVGLYAGLAWGLAKTKCNVLSWTIATRSLPRPREERPSTSLHRDIFLRTLCMVCVTVYFTSAGSRMGPLTLAANALLMQLMILYSYFTDGLANAAEALAGADAGRGDKRALHHTVRSIFKWGLGLSLFFTIIYIVGAKPFLALLTDQCEVLAVAEGFLPWIYLVPVVAIAAFVWDGVFIGLTFSRGMLIGAALALVAFFAVWFGLKSKMANHALWLAFLTYLFMRGAVQTALWKLRT